LTGVPGHRVMAGKRIISGLVLFPRKIIDKYTVGCIFFGGIFVLASIPIQYRIIPLFYSK